MKKFCAAASVLFGSLLVLGVLDHWIARGACLTFFMASFGMLMLLVSEQGNADIDRTLDQKVNH